MFGIVIDEHNLKIAFIELNEDKTPKEYVLNHGESVIEIDWNIANTMLKPKWNGTNWEETATQDELKEAYTPSSIPEPSKIENQADLINNLIIDNLNMQTQIDSLIQSNLGGN